MNLQNNSANPLAFQNVSQEDEKYGYNYVDF